MSGRKKGKSIDKNSSPKTEEDKDDDSFDEEDEVPLSKLVAQKPKENDSHDEEDEIPLSKLAAQKAKTSEGDDNDKNSRIVADSVEAMKKTTTKDDNDANNSDKEKEKEPENKPDESSSGRDKATTAATITKDPKPEEGDKKETNPPAIQASENPNDIRQEKNPATNESSSDFKSDDDPSTKAKKEEKEHKDSVVSETKESTIGGESTKNEDADNSSERAKSTESKVEKNSSAVVITTETPASVNATDEAMESSTGEKSTMKEGADGSSEKNQSSESKVENTSNAETTTAATDSATAAEGTQTKIDSKKGGIKMEAGAGDSCIPQPFEREGEIQKQYFEVHAVSASTKPPSKKSDAKDSQSTLGDVEKKKIEKEPTSSTTAKEAKHENTDDVQMKPPDASTTGNDVSMTDAEVKTKDAKEIPTTEIDGCQGNSDIISEDKGAEISTKVEKEETQKAAASITSPATLPAGSGDVSSNKELSTDIEKSPSTDKPASRSGGPEAVPLEICDENSTRRERKSSGDNKPPKGSAKNEKSEAATHTISTGEKSQIGSTTTVKIEAKVKPVESFEVDKTQGKDEGSNEPQTTSSRGSSEKPALADTNVSASTTKGTKSKNPETSKITDAGDPMEIDPEPSKSQLPEPMDVDTPSGTDKLAPAPDTSDVKSESVPTGVLKSELDSGSKAEEKAPTQTTSVNAAALDQEKATADAKKPIREIPTWIVESESEDEDDGADPFQAFTNQKSSMIDKKPAQKKLKVSFTKETNTKIEKLKKRSENMNSSAPNFISQLDEVRFIFNDLEPDTKEQLEDSLVFFRVPHEDQDPASAKYEAEQKQKEVERSLKQIEQEDLEGRKQIESYVSQLFKEKQASTDRSVEKYKQKATADLQKDMQRLQQIYKEKSQSNQDKINQGMQVLRKRHQAEIQRVAQQHRQQVQQRRIPEQMASNEWNNVSNRLHAKHQKQIHEFSAKGEEVKTRCEAEYQRDQTKLKSQHEKRHNDIEQNRKSVHSRFYQGIQQLRQRYLKRHVQKIMKQKEALTSSQKKDESSSTAAHTGDDAELSKDSSRSKNEEKAELRPPSPIKTSLDWCKDSTCRKSGAAARHKHRKGVLSQTQKQLSVEIHNEGLWIKKIPIKDELDKSKKKEAGADPGDEGDKEKKRFIPWGVKARETLESIILGEIPHGFGMDVFDLAESTTATGGHVRCVMTDLRTSEETASSQRKLAIVERAQVELIELDKKAKQKAAELSAAHSDLDRLQNEEKDATAKMKIAQKDSMDKKANVGRFREKFGSYLGPDDNPLPTTNPSDRQKLMAASMKYKTAASAAIKKENECSKKLVEAKLASQKQEAIVKQKQDEATIAANNLKKRTRPEESGESNSESNRIADIISAFDLAANKRRDQLDKKRHSNTSSAWVHTLPGVPGPLRKSLWYKMHRRRQQIVLRPSPESIILGLRHHVEQSLKDKGLSVAPVKTEKGSKAAQIALEEAQLRAEQELLLAIHPVLSPDEKLLSTPSSSSSSTWAEPGWHLELQVPKHKTTGILPRADLPPLVQRNLSEIHSAPGQQAAALVRRAHLRSLETPLSSVAIATSLGETNPTISISPAAQDTKPESDPLYVSEDVFERGYKFTIQEPPPPPKPVVAAPPLPVVATRPPPVQRKKSVTSKSQAVTQPSSKAAPKRKASATASTLNLPTTSVAPTPAPAQPEKKRKTSTASRPTQRKKVEPKQQQAASHARTTKPQPQRQKQPRQQKPRQQPQQQQRSLPQQQPKQPYMQQAPTQQAQQQFYQQQQQGPPQMQPMPQAPTQQQQYQRFMMMQQQQQQQQHQSQQNANPDQFGQMQQPPNPGYPQPPRGMQQMPPQFYQQFAVQQPMGMPGPNMPGGPPVAPGPPGGLPMNLQGNPVRQNPPPDDQNDPLFLL